MMEKKFFSWYSGWFTSLALTNGVLGDNLEGMVCVLLAIFFSFISRENAEEELFKDN